MNEPSPGVLHAEHVLLGAEFVPSPCTGAPCVSAYARETAEPVGAVLADLTGATYLLASGSDADACIAASLAGRRLAVGEVAYEATLTGTGALVSVPLLARTGDHEFVVVDAGPRGGSLSAWLEFLAHASSEEAPAFPDLGLEDASDMLVPLLLAGPAAGRPGSCRGSPATCAGRSAACPPPTFSSPGSGTAPARPGPSPPVPCPWPCAPSFSSSTSAPPRPGPPLRGWETPASSSCFRTWGRTRSSTPSACVPFWRRCRKV